MIIPNVKWMPIVSPVPFLKLNMDGDLSPSLDRAKGKGGRLARRARSFKEDLLDRLNQMRVSGSSRSQSPQKNHNKCSPKWKSQDCSYENMESGEAGPVRELQELHRKFKLALRYFQDVIEKRTYEQLDGSATILLDTVLHIEIFLSNYLHDDQSSSLLSCKNHVNQTIAGLIQWCDSLSLHTSNSFTLKPSNEVVTDIQNAVMSLVELSEIKLGRKDSSSQNDYVIGPSKNDTSVFLTPPSKRCSRNSLPELPLGSHHMLTSTPNRDSSAKCSKSLGHWHSSDSMLDGSKSDMTPSPTLPPSSLRCSMALQSNRSSNSSSSDTAPPLPPKRRNQSSINKGKLCILSGKGSKILSDVECTGNPISNEKIDNSGITKCSEDVLNAKFSSDKSNKPRNWCYFNNSSESLSASHSSLDSYSNTDETDQVPKHHGVEESSTSDNMLKPHQVQSCQISSRDDIFNLSAKFKDFNASENDSGFYSLHSARNRNLNYFSSNTSNILMSQENFNFESQHHQSVFHQTSNLTFKESKSRSYTSQSFERSCDSCSSCDLASSLPPALPAKKRTVKSKITSEKSIQSFISQQTCVSSIGPLQESNLMHCPKDMKYLGDSSSTSTSNCSSSSNSKQSSVCDDKPPLPPKKKHVMAYVQMLGNYSSPIDSDIKCFSNHSISSLKYSHQEFSEFQRHGFLNDFLTSDQKFSFTSTRDSSFEELKSPIELQKDSPPPELPPKRNKSFVKSFSFVNESPQDDSLNLVEKISTPVEEKSFDIDIPAKPVDSPAPAVSDDHEWADLEELDVTDKLFKKKCEDSAEVRGGKVSVLIVHATKDIKNDFLYQEAFLTTYRTFITPEDLVSKLIYRYNKFCLMGDHTRQRASKSSFSLLVRIVDDLSPAELEESLLDILNNFVYQLVSSSELNPAQALRRKVLEKKEMKKHSNLAPTYCLTTKQCFLLDFKSENLAEQMTLLDALLFQKIEIPEVLLWAKYQNEERSPNLTRFTEHFNKMSYWARSRILEQTDAKDRERYVTKFIKIMKHLRKLNNFNSYLALLSALDSAPIRRLEWQKQITEGLKEYCQLIDSSSSFRAYRQALSETQPPCIPYIGLVLQDLTFVHIGNPDFLPEGLVNFSKRWQQFHILENMKRFKKCHYNFKKEEKIVNFFGGFDSHLSEEALWQISESIKPRGIKSK